MSSTEEEINKVTEEQASSPENAAAETTNAGEVPTASQVMTHTTFRLLLAISFPQKFSPNIFSIPVSLYLHHVYIY